MSGLRDLVMGGSGGCDDGGAPSSSSATGHRRDSSLAANPLGTFADFLLRRGDGGGAVSSVPVPQHPVALAQKRQDYARAAAEALASSSSASLAVPGVAAGPAVPPPWAAEFQPHRHRAAPPAAPASWAGEFAAAPPAAAPFPRQHQEQSRRFVAPVPPLRSHFHHEQQQRAWAEDFSAFQQSVQQRSQQQRWHEGARAVAPLPAAAAVAAAPASAPAPPPSLLSRGPTPAERRAARGPHPDDPYEVGEPEGEEDLDDLSSFGGSAVSLTSSTSSSVSDSLSTGGRGRRPPTWVRQFNDSLSEALVRGTTNRAPALELEAEAVGALAPADGNPFLRVKQTSPSSFHDLLATARAAAERGLPGAAALALEACVRADPLSSRGWHALGLARADLGDGPGAARALSRATKLMERERRDATAGLSPASSSERGGDAPCDNSPGSSSSSSYSRALLDLALACFASGAATGASKLRAEGVEALCKWCCLTADEAAAAVADAASRPFPPPPPPGAVSVSALDEHLRARAAALSDAASPSSPAPSALSSSAPASASFGRDAWMALGVLRGLRAASGGASGKSESHAEAASDGGGGGDATAAADAFAAAAAASLLVAGGGGGPEGTRAETAGDDSQALACLGRALLSAGRPSHAVAALERATAGRDPAPASTWMVLGAARGVALERAKLKGAGGDENSVPPPHPLSAAEAFARAALSAPDASPPWESLAVALTAAGREDLAAAADARRRELPGEVLRLARAPVVVGAAEAAVNS